MSTRSHPLDQVETRSALAGGVLVLALPAARLGGLPPGYAVGLLLPTAAVPVPLRHRHGRAA